ncbi:hypothetical protein EJ03DRAFT_164506 [Teratosphaeria nubilosa]|uniref:PKS/mFAS DH domain-containing protein n=1 Tax=Teratosphaeria nubilosa TaxID=161662 RepID=A0A6G1L261_9PEZI|nr:hypothetical protein EJ03DRAFT_164506 [Teratosphaeria nubilosa]
MGTALLQYGAFSQSIDAADAFLRTALQCEWSARQEEPPHPRVLTDLPAYAWNRRALSSSLGRPARDYLHRSAAPQGLLGPRVLGTCPSKYVWRSFISLERYQWLSHHTINDTVVFPGAALISMVVQASRQIVAPGRDILTDSFRDIRIHKATLVPNDEPVELIVSMTPQQRSWTSFELWAGSPAKQPHLACTGEWRSTCVPEPDSHLAQELDLTNIAVLQDYAEHERRCILPCSHETFYENVRNIGYGYGPTFRHLRDIRTCSNEFCAHVFWDAANCSTEADMLLDPVLLDAAFQASLGAAHDVLEDVLAPQSISSIEISLPSLGVRSCDLQM